MQPSHVWHEDLFALISSVALISLGIVLFKQAGIVVGGTVGLALLLQKVTDWSFGTWFFVVNIPFYLMALRNMSKSFVLKTMLVVGSVALCGDHMDRLLVFSKLEPGYAAVVGGLLIGIGLMILFRHKASMGGFNILCLWLQERYQYPIGKTQMLLDCCVVLGSSIAADGLTLLVSVLASVIMNLVLTLNHKPGRYSPVAS